jgi:hypothetical protein
MAQHAPNTPNSINLESDPHLDMAIDLNIVPDEEATELAIDLNIVPYEANNVALPDLNAEPANEEGAQIHHPLDQHQVHLLEEDEVRRQHEG